MKLSNMIKSYTSNMRLKAKLKKRIKLNDGTVFKKGPESDLLIEKDDGTYHFEAENTACIVSKDEIEMI